MADTEKTMPIGHFQLTAKNDIDVGSTICILTWYVCLLAFTAWQMNEKTMPTVQLPGFSAVPVTIVPILEMAIGPHKGRWGYGRDILRSLLGSLGTRLFR